MAGNHLHDLAALIETLEAKGRLARVRSEVDPRHELAGVAAKQEGGPRAVLFEKVKGKRWPVLAGLYWNRSLIADLLGKEERGLPQFVANCIARWQRDPVDPAVIKTGPVLEVTEPDVDLGKIPVPVHALEDDGPSFDAAVVIAKDPESGIRNASIQRFQAVNRNTLHVNVGAKPHLEVSLEKAKRMGRSLWITLNCGVGPGLHFAAWAPAEAAPTGRDELGIASEFHGAALELVPGTESDVEMVAHAMWALECELIPGELAPAGPLAEVPGFYGKVEPRPVAHVRRIHRRHAPVFQTILSGAEVWNSVGLLGEANVLALLQRQVPGARDVHFSHGSAGFFHAIVQIAQQRAGWSKRAILAAFAAFPPLKMVTVVDDDIDIRNAQDVEWAMATRLDPASGIVTIDNAFGHGLNPSFPNAVGPKLGFDATRPFPKRAEYGRVAFRAVALEAYEIAQAEPKPAGSAAADRAAPQLTETGTAPAAAASSDYDTDRVWQRELADWKEGRGAPDGGVFAPARPAAAGDWDENRWWKRELAEMKRERENGVAPAAKKAAPVKAAPPPPPAPRPAESATRHSGSKDWDENRWWKRELEEMKREREGRKGPAGASPPPARAPALTRPPPARSADTAPEARRIDVRADRASADEDDGGFFHGGAI